MIALRPLGPRVTWITKGNKGKFGNETKRFFFWRKMPIHPCRTQYLFLRETNFSHYSHLNGICQCIDTFEHSSTALNSKFNLFSTHKTNGSILSRSQLGQSLWRTKSWSDHGFLLYGEKLKEVSAEASNSWLCRFARYWVLFRFRSKGVVQLRAKARQTNNRFNNVKEEKPSF